MGIESIQQVNLAATGQIPMQAQPGARGPLFLLPGLGYQAPIDLTQVMGTTLSRPMPGFLGSFLAGGGNTQRGSWVQKLGKNLSEGFAQVQNGGNQLLSQNMQQASAALQQNGVREAHAGEVYGQHAPGFGRGGGIQMG